MEYLGRPFHVLFAVYFLVWSFSVGSALMSACGVAAHAVVPVFDDPRTGKIVFGMLHSAVGVGLVLLGGFKLFGRVMAVCIGVMFCTVVASAVALKPDLGAVLRGLVVPTIPQFHDGGLVWSIALMGGVGGTLTVLWLRYWIREAGRSGKEALAVCRIDLAVGYAMTAVFGVAMVVVGSGIAVEGKGAGLIVALADALEEPLGPVARWAFLIGAWARCSVVCSGCGRVCRICLLTFGAWRCGNRNPCVQVGCRRYRGHIVRTYSRLLSCPCLRCS